MFILVRVSPGQRGPTLRELLPWAPTALGVCVLIVLLIIAATRFTADPAPQAVPPAQPFLQIPAPAIPPAGSPSPAFSEPAPSSPPPATSKRPLPDRQVTAPTPTRTSSKPRPRPAPGPVGGRYRVIDSYGDAFIGEVLVTNTSGQDRDWRVVLRFPPAVGELITSWVESAPQATLQRSGQTYTWTSGVPVPARSSVALRFHFSRSGSGNLPTTCTANSEACTGAG